MAIFFYIIGWLATLAGLLYSGAVIVLSTVAANNPPALPAGINPSLIPPPNGLRPIALMSTFLAASPGFGVVTVGLMLVAAAAIITRLDRLVNG